MTENVERINALEEGRWITVTDIANKLDISCGSAYSFMHEDLGYHKYCVSAKAAYR
jgi:predicted transcriptional regulator